MKNIKKLWYGGIIDQLKGKKIDLLIIDGPPGSLQKHSRFPALPVIHNSLVSIAQSFLMMQFENKNKKLFKNGYQNFQNLH